MSESGLELPPPVPPTPPRWRGNSPPWWRRSVGRWKWPGWAAIGLGGVRIFHLSEDIDFALGIARSLGGELGLIAAVLASPFFAVGLIAYGVGHLVFVGEPKWALRSRIWPAISWAVVSICLASLVGVALWGGMQSYIANQVSVRTEDRFWHLTDDQRLALGKALDGVPDDQRFIIIVRAVIGNPQALTLTEDLIDVFHQHGWTVNGSQDVSLRADLLGINFITSINWGRHDKDMPPHAAELARIFDQAHIKYNGAWEPGFDDNSLQLAIGSRPPYW